MSASDHFGPQLQMFVPAGAFVAGHMSGSFMFAEAIPGDPADELSALQRRKLRRANVPGTSRLDDFDAKSLYESIKTGGVHEPVNVRHVDEAVPTLINGHHRVLSAADIDPKKEIPVLHGGTANGSPERYASTYAHPFQR